MVGGLWEYFVSVAISVAGVEDENSFRGLATRSFLYPLPALVALDCVRFDG